MKPTYSDRQISLVFDNFVERVLMSNSLHDVALHGGAHEKAVEKIFHSVLSSQLSEDTVVRQQSTYYDGRRKIHDIVVTHKNQRIAVIEVKSIFTDPGGISSKTGKGKGLEKDMQSLKLALDIGIPNSYELVALFECFPVNKSKPINVSDSRIQWQRMQNYNPIEAEQKVNGALDRLSQVPRAGT
ncbi:MAG: hypothetical protein OXH22_09220 [Chloroflexi bacterium]|nr:hypothetical protein [Chloroflexota bacterium]